MTENILIRRPNLQVSVEAPPTQFVGTPLTYRIRISNPGSAPAENVQVTATLPPEAKYVSSVQGGQLGADRRKVTWTLPNLNTGAETALLLTATPQSSGANRLDVLATADGELMVSGNATTRVEAVANLAMDVVDPSGPVRVGDEAVYEIQVQNRGSKAAENVEVIAYFSNGIEPVSAEGARSRIGPGQVVFDPIPIVAAGQNLVLKVRARAETACNLIFRAELYCKPLSTRLVSEENTLLYDIATIQATTDTPAESTQPAPDSVTAEHTTSQAQPAPASPEARIPASAPLYK